MTETEFALLQAKVELLEEELGKLRSGTIAELQIKTDKLCKDFSTVKNIAIGMALYYLAQQSGLLGALRALL